MKTLAQYVNESQEYSLVFKDALKVMINSVNTITGKGIAVAENDNVTLVSTGKASLKVYDSKSRLADAYTLYIDTKSKTIKIIFSGYVNNSTDGLRDNVKIVKYDNELLDTIVDIMNDKSMCTKLSKDIHKEKKKYHDGYRQHMKNNPNDHS